MAEFRSWVSVIAQSFAHFPILNALCLNCKSLGFLFSHDHHIGK